MFSDPTGSTEAAPSEAEVVEIMPPTVAVGELWVPTVGGEATVLINTLPHDSRERVSTEAAATMARCVPPHQVGDSRTGLVIGYVQSGKTMSFTTVTAMARDNGFPLVIVVAGTSTPLSVQSKDRLLRDLRIQSRSDRKWGHFHNPRNTDRPHIANLLAAWNDSDVPESNRQTVVITVMKNTRHLQNLRAHLQSQALRDLVEGLPALIIDDEADQASMNTQGKRGGQSTTYRLLLDLRAALPQHTFLQYTATPQAPLLINIIDALSPDFAQVLTPGDAYTGGADFFLRQPSLVRVIPQLEIPSRDNPLTETPDSLLDAMRFFFLGVAAALVQGETNGNRSMMVHPSQRVSPHQWYLSRVLTVIGTWSALLELAESDPDRQDLIESFRPAYNDLSSTVSNLPPFEALMSQMRVAVRMTQIHEVNAQAGRTPEINWVQAYSHILVGGQAMDRGFTVEGLTVTYMPRGGGVGNADTIQQRARFFGYKRPYLGYCRVFLESEVRDAYLKYVEHEEDIRRRMIEFSATGRPLAEWRRAFWLSSDLKPTRSNVLGLDYIQDTFNNDWFTTRSPHGLDEVTQANRDDVAAFLSGLTLHPDSGHPDRTPDQVHTIAEDVPLQAAYENLLTRFRLLQPSESQRLLGLCLQVEHHLEHHPDARCTVVHIKGGGSRNRGVNSDLRMGALQQGGYPSTPGPLQSSIYPGDSRIRSEDNLTLQIHTLRLTRKDAPDIENVPAIAVYVPGAMSKDWLVQRESAAASVAPVSPPDGGGASSGPN